MCIQGYSTAVRNAKTSLNTKLRAVSVAISAGLHLTSVAASPAPTTTVFAVANLGLLKPTDWIQVTISGTPRQTQITSLSGSTLTVYPPLPSAPAAAAAVSQVFSWYPPGARANLKPSDIQYPFLYAVYRRAGSYDVGRQRLKTEVQIGVATNLGREADADRLFGQVLTQVGIDIDNHLQFAEIPQTDTESGQSLALRDMDLHILQGPEPLADPDPGVTHLFSDFHLFHQ